MQGKRSATKEQVQQPRAYRILRAVLRALLLLAALLLALLVVLKYDSLTPQALRDAVSPQQEEISGTYSERLTFAANSLNSYATYRDGIAVLSPSGIEIQNASGEQVISVSKNFAHPVTVRDGGSIAAFDVGGSAFVLIKDGQLMQNMSYSHPIVAADVASNGTYAISAEEGGVRSAVSVFDCEGNPLYKYFSSERFVIGCALNNSADMLAAAGIRQEDTHIISAVVLMSLSSEEPIETWETTDELILAVEFLSGDRILVITENRAVFLNANGKYRGEYSFEDTGLAMWSEGDGFVVLCPATRTAAENSHIVLVSSNGDYIGELAAGDLVSVSAAEDEFGILTNDTIVVYNKKMERIAQRNLVGGGKYLLLGNGAALVFSSDTADVYTYR